MSSIAAQALIDVDILARVSPRDLHTDYVRWTPTGQQKKALRSAAKFTLFGGARGGGKSDGSIHWLTKRVKNPNMLGLVLRRNAKDLIEFINRANKVFKRLGAIKTGSPQSGGVKFVFPSGAEIYTGHLANEDSFEAYQGWNITDMVIEELTHIPTLILFQSLLGSLRSIDPTLPPRFFATTNPTNIGFEWVKAYWRIGDIPDEQYFTEEGITKIYIPAGVYDNPHLLKGDPEYVKYLESLPVDLRERWLKGSWEDIVSDAQIYGIDMLNAKKQGRITSVPVEAALRTFVAFDLGLKDLMVYWILQIHGREKRLVKCYGERNKPIKHYSDKLREFEQETGATIEEVFLPHDAEVRSMIHDDLMTRKEKMEELGWSCTVLGRLPKPDSIENGRTLIQSAYFDKKGCKDGLRALRNYSKEFDEKANRYKDKPLHDWCADWTDCIQYMGTALPDIEGGQVINIDDIARKIRMARGGNMI